MQPKDVTLNNRLENEHHVTSFWRKKVFDVFKSNKKYIQQIDLEWLRTRMKLQNHGLENGRKVIK